MKKFVLAVSLIASPMAIASTLSCEFPGSVKFEATLSPTGHMSKATVNGALVSGNIATELVPSGGASIQTGNTATYPAGNRNYEITDPSNSEIIYTVSIPLRTGSLPAIIVKENADEANFNVQINNVTCQNQ